MISITYKQFYFLLSAMLFVSEEHDQDEIFNEYYIAFCESLETDPVVWARDWFAGCYPDTHDIYIRPTFTAQSWSKIGQSVVKG